MDGGEVGHEGLFMASLEESLVMARLDLQVGQVLASHLLNKKKILTYEQGVPEKIVYLLHPLPAPYVRLLSTHLNRQLPLEDILTINCRGRSMEGKILKIFNKIC